MKQPPFESMLCMDTKVLALKGWITLFSSHLKNERVVKCRYNFINTPCVYLHVYEICVKWVSWHEFLGLIGFIKF